MSCRFCDIVSGSIESEIVWEGEDALAFLDYRPLFPGHTLLVPKAHYETLASLPQSLAASLFLSAQRLSAAVERAMEADGTFVAINNGVSLSVPHLHIHIVPRRKRDGLRGFFWPRQKYRDPEHARSVADLVRRAASQV